MSESRSRDRGNRDRLVERIEALMELYRQRLGDHWAEVFQETVVIEISSGV